MTDIPALLAETRAALDEARVAYATIGGCAEPRATKDVWEYLQRWCDDWEIGDRVAELRRRG